MPRPLECAMGSDDFMPGVSNSFEAYFKKRLIVAKSAV